LINKLPPTLLGANSDRVLDLLLSSCHMLVQDCDFFVLLELSYSFLFGCVLLHESVYLFHASLDQAFVVANTRRPVSEGVMANLEAITFVNVADLSLLLMG
jgi:hypothetical protein